MTNKRLITSTRKLGIEKIKAYINGTRDKRPQPDKAGYAYLYITNGKKFNIYHSAISCHGALMGPLNSLCDGRKGKGLTLVSVYGGYDKASKEFWKFISNKEISPWRDLFQKKWTLIKDDEDNIQGYIVPTDVLNTPGLIPLLYNFMIMARQTIETPHVIEAWYVLVKTKKYSPARAILLSRFFNGSDFKKGWGALDGSHFPISENAQYTAIGGYGHYTPIFNPKAFEEGDYNKDKKSTHTSSMMWCYSDKKNKVKNAPYLKPKIGATYVKSRFSKVAITRIDECIIDFDRQINERIEGNA